MLTFSSRDVWLATLVASGSVLLLRTVSFEEFQEGSKQDPTIVQALSLYDGLV